MREYPDNHRRLFNCCDDPEFAATLRAVFEVELEHALEQARPAHPRRRAVRMFVCRFALRRTRHDRRAQPGIGRERPGPASVNYPETSLISASLHSSPLLWINAS